MGTTLQNSVRTQEPLVQQQAQNTVVGQGYLPTLRNDQQSGQQGGQQGGEGSQAGGDNSGNAAELAARIRNAGTAQIKTYAGQLARRTQVVADTNPRAQ